MLPSHTPTCWQQQRLHVVRHDGAETVADSHGREEHLPPLHLHSLVGGASKPAQPRSGAHPAVVARRFLRLNLARVGKAVNLLALVPVVVALFLLRRRRWLVVARLLVAVVRLQLLRFRALALAGCCGGEPRRQRRRSRPRLGAGCVWWSYSWSPSSASREARRAADIMIGLSSTSGSCSASAAARSWGSGIDGTRRDP